MDGERPKNRADWMNQLFPSNERSRFVQLVEGLLDVIDRVLESNTNSTCWVVVEIAIQCGNSCYVGGFGFLGWGGDCGLESLDIKKKKKLL